MSTQVVPNNPETQDKKTTAGSYFVSNYPPFSFWSADEADRVMQAIETPPDSRYSAGTVPAYPLLPQTLPFLLFQGLYGQEFSRYPPLCGGTAEGTVPVCG